MTLKLAACGLTALLLAACGEPVPPPSTAKAPASAPAAPAPVASAAVPVAAAPAAVPAAPGSTASTGLAREFPYATLPKAPGGTCMFDKVAVEGEQQVVLGWAVVSAQQGTVAEKVVLGFTTPAGEMFTIPTVVQREDVATHLKQPGGAASGFAAGVPKAQVPAGSKITIYQVRDGKVHTCETVSTT